MTTTHTNRHVQGTFQNTKYFDTEKGAVTGRFCRASDIVNSEATSASKFMFAIGDTVLCCKPLINCKGTVRYFGIPAWATHGRVYFGLELAEEKGDCDGSKHGTRYFETEMRRALYVLPKHVAPGLCF